MLSHYVCGPLFLSKKSAHCLVRPSPTDFSFCCSNTSSQLLLGIYSSFAWIHFQEEKHTSLCVKASNELLVIPHLGLEGCYFVFCFCYFVTFVCSFCHPFCMASMKGLGGPLFGSLKQSDQGPTWSFWS